MSDLETHSQNDKSSSVSLSRSDYFNRHNKRLRKSVRQVPWQNELELQEVGNALLSVLQECEQSVGRTLEEENNGLNTMVMSPQEAFAMVSVWKSRLSSLEGLPHAIESTGALAQVYWKDTLRRKQYAANCSDGIGVMDLRLAYATAIVRCVNGFADSLQQHRGMKASVSNLCGQLGIPSWLVDTRHESSHNALPSIEVLRLSVVTLLEFIKSEFWIPRCNNRKDHVMKFKYTVQTEQDLMSEHDDKNEYNSQNNHHPDAVNRKGGIDHTPIDMLLAYTACASTWASTRSTISYDEETKKHKITNSSLPRSDRKNKKASVVKKMTILPYDPLFGEVGSPCSSSDCVSDGDDDNEDDNFGVSIYGSSIGTSTNRFALLEIPKKGKKKNQKGNKKKPKMIRNISKKKKGEKTPNDYAKLFIKAVSSPQEGYVIAIKYLIWGDGVLIPDMGKEVTSSSQGVAKCWEHYTPLIHEICRAWPGFAACILINLVDLVLIIEGAAVCKQKDHIDVDAGSSRQLHFLSAWVHLLLSQRFIAAIDRKFSIFSSMKRKSNNQRRGETHPSELPTAQISHLETLGYPLNSLLDRCIQHNRNSTANNNDTISSNVISDSTKTSLGIIQSLEKIVGTQRTENFGYFYESDKVNAQHEDPTNDQTNDSKNTAVVVMSLDEMEGLLSDSRGAFGEVISKTDTNLNVIKAPNMVSEEASIKSNAPNIGSHPNRPAWIRCKRWDTCSIGSLPGYSAEL